MMKGEGNIDENTHKRVYPTGASALKFYGLPEIHKEDIPLNSIKHRICHIWGGKRAVKNFETPSW